MFHAPLLRCSTNPCELAMEERERRIKGRQRGRTRQREQRGLGFSSDLVLDVRLLSRLLSFKSTLNINKYRRSANLECMVKSSDFNIMYQGSNFFKNLGLTQPGPKFIWASFSKPKPGSRS